MDMDSSGKMFMIYYMYIYTIWLLNIAMENPHFE